MKDDDGNGLLASIVMPTYKSIHKKSRPKGNMPASVFKTSTSSRRLFVSCVPQMNRAPFMKDILEVTWDTLAVFYRLYLLKYYDK